MWETSDAFRKSAFDIVSETRKGMKIDLLALWKEKIQAKKYITVIKVNTYSLDPQLVGPNKIGGSTDFPTKPMEPGCSVYLGTGASISVSSVLSARRDAYSTASSSLNKSRTF